MEDYATKYKTADNQQDIILRRRQKVIAVFEKDMVTTIEAGQMLYAKRFVDNLKKSEALLKKHESTKTILFTRRRNESRGQTDGRKEVPRNVANATQKEKNTRTSQAEFQEQETRKRTRNSVSINRSFSAKLREVNKNMNVREVKLLHERRPKEAGHLFGIKKEGMGRHDQPFATKPRSPPPVAYGRR